MSMKMALLIVLLAIVALGLYLFYLRFTNYGTLVIKIVDPPREWGEATHVYIRYSEIAVHRADVGNESGWYEVATGSEIDLADVVNVSRVVGKASLPAGKYNLIRFRILQAVVTIANKNYSAEVPPGEITVVIIGGGVEIQPSKTTYLVIDVNTKVVGSRETGFKIVPAATAYPEE
ncbi:MAG: DUF4382 domain-containing protein [Ignisphaera sp.]